MGNLAALTQAISLTDEILAVLEAKNFAAVSELEARRHCLITEAFSQSAEEIDRIKAAHLQNLNDQVVEKLSDFKQSVLEQQRQLRNASKATSAYASYQ